MWARNVLVTFLLSGLWHGASWNYVLWGALPRRAAGPDPCTPRPEAGTAGGVAARSPLRLLARSPQIAGMFVLTN